MKKPPELKWSEEDHGEFTTVLSGVPYRQTCQECEAEYTKKNADRYDEWTIILTWDVEHKFWGVAIFCPNCADAKLEHLNRAKECEREVGPRRAGRCIDEKSKREGRK